MSHEHQEELLTVQEVAGRLRVDETTVRRRIRAGVLEAIALPHPGARQRNRIRKSALDAIINSVKNSSQSGQHGVPLLAPSCTF